jgi:hypothetical protein
MSTSCPSGRGVALLWASEVAIGTRQNRLTKKHTLTPNLLLLLVIFFSDLLSGASAAPPKIKSDTAASVPRELHEIYRPNSDETIGTIQEPITDSGVVSIFWQSGAVFQIRVIIA